MCKSSFVPQKPKYTNTKTSKYRDLTEVRSLTSSPIRRLQSIKSSHLSGLNDHEWRLPPGCVLQLFSVVLLHHCNPFLVLEALLFKLFLQVPASVGRRLVFHVRLQTVFLRPDGLDDHHHVLASLLNFLLLLLLS